ncbi:MAG: metallophosphoesterase [Phycisphaerales bacterium]
MSTPSPRNRAGDQVHEGTRGPGAGRAGNRDGNGNGNRRSAKYIRAALRHLIFTTGPNRLSRGSLLRRHLAQDVEIREVEIRSPRWPKAFDGIRIAHVSDLHVGDLLPVDRAVRIVEEVRALEPDLLACTGDVVDLDNSVAPPVLDALRAVDAAMGNLLVLGNHDHLDDAEALVEMARRAGMTVLRDEAIELVGGGGRLALGGVEWSRTIAESVARVERLVGVRPPPAPRGRGVRGATGPGAAPPPERTLDLLLSHNPKAFRAAARLGIPLTLAGHTHGGQIARKRQPTHNLAFAHGHNRGLYRHDSSHLFVTTGIGAWFPLRINCPPEIAIVTVRSGQPE